MDIKTPQECRDAWALSAAWARQDQEGYAALLTPYMDDRQKAFELISAFSMMFAQTYAMFLDVPMETIHEGLEVALAQLVLQEDGG